MSDSPSAHSPDFSGLWIPLVTPFCKGAVDHAALARLVAYYRGSGVAGFVVCGSTGEAAALDDDEQLAVLDTVTASAGTLRVIMGVSGYHLRKVEAQISALAGRPLAGVLLPAPSYIRPSQSGLLDWFDSLASASAFPVIVYDIPSRTGSQLALATLLSLAAHPNIFAVKDCAGDAGKTRALIASASLQVLAGDDADLFDTVARGGQGAIAASAHVQTQRFAEIIRLIRQGNLAEARQLWQPLLPLVNAVFAEPNPGPIKALLAAKGLLGSELRRPMTEASAALAQELLRLDAVL